MSELEPQPQLRPIGSKGLIALADSQLRHLLAGFLAGYEGLLRTVYARDLIGRLAFCARHGQRRRGDPLAEDSKYR
jgi:hypothetical protein